MTVSRPSDHATSGVTEERLQRAEHIIGALDKGIAVLSTDFAIRWINDYFRRWCPFDPVGRPFSDCFHESIHQQLNDEARKVAIAGGAFCFRLPHEKLVLDITISPVRDHDRVVEFVALCDDVTEAVLRQQKLQALHKAGEELDSLDPGFLNQTDRSCRAELLRLNVKRLIHEILKYDVIEIRLLNRETGELIPLLEEGMLPEAAARRLVAQATENGVTGWVAATGEPYLCHDAARDKLYLEGSVGAKSSMTVPIIFNSETIGTFNVESPRLNAFGPEDLQFTELFARELGRALHTLNLLDAGETCAATLAIDSVQRETALPWDDLLAAASKLAEPNVEASVRVASARLVLANARSIQQSVNRVRSGVDVGSKSDFYDRLREKRILVLDSDERIRRMAHNMLEKQGCIVETAATAADGLAIARSGVFDVVLTAIKHPDAGGTATYVALSEAQPKARLILTQAFEYDPGHTVPNLKTMNYDLTMVFKPFKEDQLFPVLVGIRPPSIVMKRPTIPSPLAPSSSPPSSPSSPPHSPR